MSVEASISVRYSISWKNDLYATQLIQILLLEGWTFGDDEGSSYLPLGETEGFDWIIQEKISSDLLMNILIEKEKRHEIIGVVMTWQDTNIGGSFIFREEHKLSILLNVNKKIIPNGKITKLTDVNWYFSHLIPIFEENNIEVCFFAFEQLA